MLCHILSLGKPVGCAYFELTRCSMGIMLQLQQWSLLVAAYWMSRLCWQMPAHSSTFHDMATPRLRAMLQYLGMAAKICYAACCCWIRLLLELIAERCMQQAVTQY